MGGRLSAWSAGRASASGLEGVAQGELVEIDGSGPALVTALLADRVELAPLSPRAPRAGAPVRSLGPLATPAGEDLVGRAIDCLGRPLDGGPEVAREHAAPIFERDPVVIEPTGRRFTLGALVYDLQRVIPVGASLLAVGPDPVLHHVLRHQVAAGRVVVVATPAATAAAHLDARRGARPARPGLPSVEPVRCVHVAAARDATPAQQWLVPWSAMAIASGLRARGRDVVVALDHLDAWRPHVRAFAARGAWGTQLAQLAARAYARPIGSVSLIALTREVSVTRAAAFDEVLDLSVAVRGELPATGTSLVRPPIRVPSIRLLAGPCFAAARRVELEHLGRAAPRARLDRATRLALDEADRFRECLRFRIGASVDSLEQELGLLAVATRPDVPAHAVPDFVDRYLARLRRDHAITLAASRAAGRMNTDDERALLAVAAEIEAG